MWPSLAIVWYSHLVSQQAHGLHHQAVFRDSDAPSVWSCNQCKINFWPIESNIFRNNTFPKVSGTEVDTTSCILLNHSFKQKVRFTLCTQLFLFFCILVNPETNKKYVITWSDQNVIGLMPILPCKRRTVRLQDRLGTIHVDSYRTCIGLLTSGLCQAGGCFEFIGLQVHRKCKWAVNVQRFFV